MVNSEFTFVNLSPLLSSWGECYVNTILYKPFDIVSYSVPIVITSPRFDNYENDTSCIAKSNSRKFRSNYTYNYNPNLCPYVLKNYLIKGVKCVGVLALYPDGGGGVEEEDVYWYLNHYWSRADLQNYTFERIVSVGKDIEEDISFPSFFPSEIYIQIVLSANNYEARKNGTLKRKEIEDKRIWEAFILLPVLTIVPPNARELFTPIIALSLFVHNYYFAEFRQTISNTEGKFSFEK